VFIPSFLSLSHSDANPTATPTANPNLIQEITIPLPTPTRADSDSGYTGTKLKGILETGQRSDSDKSPRNANTEANMAPVKPTWSWAEQDGRLQIMIRVPKLVRLHSSADFLLECPPYADIINPYNLTTTANPSLPLVSFV
jgi:hypothetical protein